MVVALQQQQRPGMQQLCQVYIIVVLGRWRQQRQLDLAATAAAVVVAAQYVPSTQVLSFCRQL